MSASLEQMIFISSRLRSREYEVEPPTVFYKNIRTRENDYVD